MEAGGRRPPQCSRLLLLLSSLCSQEANSTSQQPDMLCVPSESPQEQRWESTRGQPRALLSPGSEPGTFRDRERFSGLPIPGSQGPSCRFLAKDFWGAEHPSPVSSANAHQDEVQPLSTESQHQVWVHMSSIVAATGLASVTWPAAHLGDKNTHILPPPQAGEGTKCICQYCTKSVSPGKPGKLSDKGRR